MYIAPCSLVLDCGGCCGLKPNHSGNCVCAGLLDNLIYREILKENMTMLGNYSDHSTVSQIRYSEPTLSTGITYQPQGLWTPKIDAENIAYDSLNKPFSLAQYLYPRPPIDMGLVEQDEYKCSTNVLRMPLKFPKTEYRIPKELEGTMPLISRIAEYEAFINPRHAEFFCHITYDHSVVEEGHYHRYPGFHGDGIQGTKLTPKVEIEHSYILVTSPPTEFCLQPFFLKHLDEAKHNFFLEFDRQAHEVNVYRSLSDHLYLIDPYMVHRTPKITKRVERTFVRITYAVTELQHPNNTVNPMFSGQEYAQRIDVRKRLYRNEFDVPYHLYGLSK
jgi:hypothetical protein